MGKNTLLPKKKTMIISKVMNCTSSWKWCVGHSEQNWWLKFCTLSFKSWLTASLIKAGNMTAVEEFRIQLLRAVFDKPQVFLFIIYHKSRFVTDNLGRGPLGKNSYAHQFLRSYAKLYIIGKLNPILPGGRGTLCPRWLKRIITFKRLNE